MRLNFSKILLVGITICVSPLCQASGVLVSWNNSGDLVKWNDTVKEAWNHSENRVKRKYSGSNYAFSYIPSGNTWMKKDVLNFYSAVSRKYRIPKNLLLSISINETEVGGFPWPWTLNVDGQGYYYKNRIDEYKAIKNFIKDGSQFIDIGPMQMDWEYHGKMFTDIWQATNPSVNISAAAYLLTSLYDKTGSWKIAVADYHSAVPAYGIPYMQHVYYIRNNIYQLKNSIEKKGINNYKVVNYIK